MTVTLHPEGWNLESLTSHCLHPYNITEVIAKVDRIQPQEQQAQEKVEQETFGQLLQNIALRAQVNHRFLCESLAPRGSHTKTCTESA